MASAVAYIAELLGSDLLLKGAGGAAFALHNASTWQWWHYIAWVSIILLGMEILSQLVLLFGKYVAASRMGTGVVFRRARPHPICAKSV